MVIKPRPFPVREVGHMYPSMEQVEAADIVQLCRWTRFLPSPGLGAVGKVNFEVVLGVESAILHRIIERQSELGGMTPAISKAIGW